MTVTNQNQKMTDYKSYSLEQLENWIHDAISCGEASPHEIYSSIKKTVQEEYNIHRDYTDRCFGLLELLHGHRPMNHDLVEHYYPDQLNNNMSWTGSVMTGLSDDVISFDKQSPTRWILPVEVDGASGEYYLQLPDDLLDALKWEEGDTLEYSDNGDGSFKLTKVTKSLKMDEC